MNNWLQAEIDRFHAQNERDPAEILIRRTDNPESPNRRWHIADPEDGGPIFGDFINTYQYFASKREALRFVRERGRKPVFD
jgi:hypothetical protein